MDYLKKVEEFHKTFNHPVLEEPQLAPINRAQLRIALLKEELRELEEAIENNDLIEVADALCDLQYVLSGAILEFGLKDKFDEMFDEVQRSNMSKACQTIEEAEETMAKYSLEGVEVSATQVGDVFVITRNTDGKILKSINYSAAQLGQILNS